MACERRDPLCQKMNMILLRSHVLEVKERAIISGHFANDYKVKSLNPIKIDGSKMNALLSRAAARDLYMIH